MSLYSLLQISVTQNVTFSGCTIPKWDCLWVVGEVGEEKAMSLFFTRAIHSTITADLQPC